MSLDEERKWKRILSETTVLSLQDNDKSKIFKVRVYADKSTVDSSMHLYLLTHLFEKKATVSGFLTFLFGKGLDYEILETKQEERI